MTTLTLKKELHKTIDSITDKAILEAVYTLLQKSVEGSSLRPMSESDFLKRNTRSQKDIKEGKVVSHTDVKKRFN
jgi:hypothetical protein